MSVSPLSPVFLMASKRVIKYHLKKNDAVKALVKRSSTAVRTRFQSVEELDDVPANLRHFINPIVEAMNDVKTKVQNGEQVINTSLRKLTEEQLKSLASIYERKVGVATEDKLIQSCYEILPAMRLIDKAIPHLEHLRLQILDAYILAYSNEYHIQKGSDYVFNNDAFVRDVLGEISFRRGIRQSVQQEVEQEEPQDERGSCVMM